MRQAFDRKCLRVVRKTSYPRQALAEHQSQVTRAKGGRSFVQLSYIRGHVNKVESGKEGRPFVS